jgi:hypothetical protein
MRKRSEVKHNKVMQVMKNCWLNEGRPELVLGGGHIWQEGKYGGEESMKKGRQRADSYILLDCEVARTRPRGEEST